MSSVLIILMFTNPLLPYSPTPPLPYSPTPPLPRGTLSVDIRTNSFFAI
ncbi:MAG: hypothetical protein F6K39_17885 [Okeania sp. SIO3B3]|nr:hypothetical protein [Okeania sp. SIO3B3]